MNRIALILLAAATPAVAFFGPGATALRADLSIAPAFVEVTLDKGRPTGQFEIANLGDKEERYRVKALFFNFSADGRLQRLEPDEHSLSSSIKFNPTEVLVAPKASRVVRFVILPKPNLPPGEYWAAMELENLNTQVGKGADAGGHELKIEVITTILVPIFGKAGTVRYEGDLGAFKAEPDDMGTRLEATVTNQGTGRLLVKGQYEITDAAGKSVAKEEFGYAYILPGRERRFVDHVKVPLPAGQYTLSVRYESPQLKNPLESRTNLTLTALSKPPEPKPAEPKPPAPPENSPSKPPATPVAARDSSARAAVRFVTADDAS